MLSLQLLKHIPSFAIATNSNDDIKFPKFSKKPFGCRVGTSQSGNYLWNTKHFIVCHSHKYKHQIR